MFDMVLLLFTSFLIFGVFFCTLFLVIEFISQRIASFIVDDCYPVHHSLTKTFIMIMMYVGVIIFKFCVVLPNPPIILKSFGSIQFINPLDFSRCFISVFILSSVVVAITLCLYHLLGHNMYEQYIERERMSNERNK